MTSIQAMMEAQQKIQSKIFQIWVRYNTQATYSPKTIALACQEVSSHWPAPALTTLSLIESGDPALNIEFVAALAKVSTA